MITSGRDCKTAEWIILIFEVARDVQNVPTESSHFFRHVFGVQWIYDTQSWPQCAISNSNLGFHFKQIEHGDSGGLTASATSRRNCN